jgi:predicted dehydrogenase
MHRFESRFERWRPEVKPGWKERPGPAPGVLWDLGPHVIDQALVACGPVESVSGTVRTLRPGALVPDDAFLVLRHSSGVESQLSVSLAAAAPGPRFRILGTRGAFVKDGLDPQEEQLRAGAVPGGDAWGEEPEERWGTLTSESSGTQVVPTLPGDYPQFYRLMTDHLRGDGPLPVDPMDSVRVLEIIEAVSGGPGAP